MVTSKTKWQPTSNRIRKPVPRSQTQPVKTKKTRLPLSHRIQVPAKSVAAKPLTPITVKPKETEPQSDSTVIITVTPDEPAPPTSVPIPVPGPVRKAVRFHDSPPEPLLFNRQAPAEEVKSPLDSNAGWSPLKLNVEYSGSLQATGFKTMFESTSLQTIALKRRVLHRFKAVQQYEERHKEDLVANGEQPTLGQLEYGNADYKLNLQANKVVTAHDIGCFVDPTELGIPLSVYDPVNGPFLHFGGFEDEYGRTFEDAVVPVATTVPFKKPIGWPLAPSDTALDKWVKLQFSVMQPADLAG